MTKFEVPIMSIDYGIKSTGFALSLDGSNTLFLKDKSTGNLHDILRVIEIYKPKTIVFGLPINSGSKRQSDIVKSIAGNINQATKAKIQFQDERFTSQIAYSTILNETFNKKQQNSNRLASRKEILAIKDESSAFIILEMFLAKAL